MLARPPYNFLVAPEVLHPGPSRNIDSPSPKRRQTPAPLTMICRTCLRRAPGFSLKPIASRASFSTTLRMRDPAAQPATPTLTPLADTPAAETKAPLSSCPAGTPLTGLNYFKGKTDPVALPDEAYPAWLWKCLEVQKKTDSAVDANAGDEFCMDPLFLRSPVTSDGRDCTANPSQQPNQGNSVG